jgi:hypothetical protein
MSLREYRWHCLVEYGEQTRVVDLFDEEVDAKREADRLALENPDKEYRVCGLDPVYFVDKAKLDKEKAEKDLAVRIRDEGMPAIIEYAESFEFRVNSLGRVYEATLKPWCYELAYGVRTKGNMEVMLAALEKYPEKVKVVKNSRNRGRFPDDEYDGQGWLNTYEVHQSGTWYRPMSEKRKRACGLAPLLGDTNHRIRLRDGRYFSGVFGKDGSPGVVKGVDANSFWRCTRRETAERWLQKIKDSGDQRGWAIEPYQWKAEVC